MNHHSKRRRLDYDDPDAELYEKRARNDLHLKSRFEAIFEKFGKDFSEVGDEIDLQTGRIVVNNGHLDGMAHEQDLGQPIDPSSPPLSRHRIATEDLEDVASSAVECTAGSLLDSDTEMEDVLSDSRVDLLNRDTGQIAASDPSSRQDHYLKHRRTQTPEPDETPLRRLNVDSVLNRLHSRRMTMYDSPIEPAWQVPPLPVDKIAQAQRPIPKSKWSEENGKRRSASPNLGSLWTPFPSRGPAKCDAAAIDSRKATSKVARAKAWTLGEESLLQHLRTNTTLTYRQLVPHFPGRSPDGIANHWRQVLVPNLSKHKGYRAKKSDAIVVAIAANVEDADADELQAYDYVFQTSKTLMQSENIREPTPNAFLFQPKVPSLTTEVPFKDFLDSLQQYSRSEPSEVLGHSSPSIDPQTPQESHPAAKTHFYQRSPSTPDPAPVPQVVGSACAASSTSPTLKARKRKEHISPNKAMTASNTPSRSIDDSSEDELATPFNAPRNVNLATVLTGSKTLRSSSKLQSPHLESGSEDELSTPLQQRLVPRKIRAQKRASNRRKSSCW